jgi:hypothetical protein
MLLDVLQEAVTPSAPPCTTDPTGTWDKTHGEYKHHESLGEDFHTYGLIWTEKRMTTYFDRPDNIVLDVDMSTLSNWERGGFSNTLNNPWKGETPNAPFNREFYLVLNVAVGGTNSYFPDGQCGKTWTNNDQHSPNAFWGSKGAWYPTWNYPATHDAAMKIDSIKVW